MKLKNLLLTTVALALFSAFYSPCLTVLAQGTAFTYQGRLNASGSPANGNYDLQFALFDAVTNGNQITPAVTNTAVTVSNGLFTTAIDFGNIFNGSNDWLDVAVRTNGANSFAVLTPRQPITPTPYALYANSASNVSGTISANQLSGAIPLAQLPSTVITNGASGVNISGVFSGDGAGVTNVSDNSLVITTTTNDPTIVPWGYNYYGQTNVPAGLSNIVAVATGASFSLALKNDGTVVAWGDNSLGQTDVPADLSNVMAVAAGYHTLALKRDGLVVAWGLNVYGETNVPRA